MSRRTGLGGVACPSCHHKSSDVMDSRPVAASARLRRRRRCSSCDHRFTTFEAVEVEDMPPVEDLLDLRPLPKILRSVVATVYDVCVEAADR